VWSKKTLFAILILAPIGGTIGALLTLNMGNDVFKLFIPWLILGTTFLIGQREYLINLLQSNANSYKGKVINIFSFLLLFLTAIYGGFFGAGLGILLIASLSMYHDTDLNGINAVKIVMSIFINCAAVIMYILWGMIDWKMACIQMLGAALGGYMGGVIGRSLNPHILKSVITIMGLILSVIYFYEYGYFSFLF
jgi:uncharacterized membrane protein YfcA